VPIRIKLARSSRWVHNWPMRVEADAEASGLRALLRDLVALSAIPGVWVERAATVAEPGTEAVATELADALVGLLELDFAFVRLHDPAGAGAADVTRGDAWHRFPEWLERHRGDPTRLTRKELVTDAGDGPRAGRGIAIPIGLDGEGGIIAVACERGGFPTATDQLLLSLAANHAATAFQGARLIHERRRADDEVREARDRLVIEVAERTAELRQSEASMSQLAHEQAALRRVATLVAKEAPPARVFEKVAEELANMIGDVDCSLFRDEGDGTASAVALWGAGITTRASAGMRLPLDGDGVIATVISEGRSCRIGDYSTVTGAIAELGRELGIRSAVGCPIVVGGRIWGAMGAARYQDEALPPETEMRMAQLAELVATAIANAQARADVERLAEEQAALRRVAMLVAQGGSPTAVLDAVAGEVGRLLQADEMLVSRYEPGDEVTVVAQRGSGARGVPVGSRVKLKAGDVQSIVGRSGRSARLEHAAHAPGAKVEAAHEAGVRSVVGAPIVVEGRQWGVISASWTRVDSPPPDTEARMVRFAQLLETAIANADSRAQLIASRARLVTASDEARRRVVRDLHDGAQQRLVHTILTLKLAQQAVRAGKESVELLVDEALEHAELSNAELRELARGILPAVLTISGLRAGIETVVDRLDVPVDVQVVDERFPPEIEASTYFIVGEALTNVVKHSHAKRTQVRVFATSGALHVEVRDDGVGGVDPRGHGVVGIADRAAALGGQLDIESPPGGGTHLAATLPLPAG